MLHWHKSWKSSKPKAPILVELLIWLVFIGVVTLAFIC